MPSSPRVELEVGVALGEEARDVHAGSHRRDGAEYLIRPQGRIPRQERVEVVGVAL
jgi:hypothetical protein